MKDSAGAVIVGATIKATNTDTGFSQTVTSGESGLYRIVLLPPGSYKVTVTQQGFSDAGSSVQVGVGRIADLNVVLAVGGRKEEITVAAEAIEVTRNEAAAFVNSTIVANMPLNGRKFQDLALLTPAAIVENSRQQISMVGQRGINASINIDGSDYGNPFFGGLRGGERSNFAPTVPQEAIQEFQMVRAGYSAEFGRSTGGIMTAVTKSGTNAIHGEVDYNIRHKDLSATNQFFEDQTTQLQTKPGCATCTVVPAPTLQQWGGSAGGPLIKDRWFVFGAYTQQRNRIPHVVLFDQLSAAGVSRSFGPAAYDFYLAQQTPYEQTNDSKALLLKSDYQMGNAHRLSVKYGYSSNQALNASTAGTAILPNVTSALSNNGTELDSTHTGVVQLASFFGQLANDFRVEYTRETRPRNANAQAPTVGNNIGTFGTVSFLGQNIEKDWRMQFADAVTVQKGSHSLKLGFDISHLDAFQLFGFNQNGALSFGTSSNNTLLNIMTTGVPGVTISGAPARYTATGNLLDGNCSTSSSAAAFSPCVFLNKQIGNLKASLLGNQIALFFQDSWRIRPSLTINYGLRWEGSQNPKAAADNLSMVNKVKGFVFPNGRVEDPGQIPNQWGQFAPRVGFAWDPKGNGKTVVRGFGGIYYAATPLLTFAGPVNNFRATPGDLSIQLPFSVGNGTGACASAANCRTLYQQFRLIGIDLNQYGTAANIPASVFSVSNVQAIATQLGTLSALPGGTGPDPFFGAQPILTDLHYRNPTSYQTGFGIEREVAHNWTVGVQGIWVNTVYLERNFELNLPVPTISASDPALRPQFVPFGTSGSVRRPIASLGSIQARDSSARSLYRGLTFSSTTQRKWGQVILYYTLSETTSTDDNERDAGGIKYENAFPVCGAGVCAPALLNQYGFSSLDRRHQFVASPVFYLPKGFEVSSAIRILSGAPFDPTMGSFDANGDTVRGNDYPYWAPGVPFRRNSFRNLGFKTVDLRVQKGIKFGESKLLKLSAEMFNLLNFMNMTYGGNTSLNYCTASSNVCGIPGQAWTKNVDFMQLREQNTTSRFFGQYLGNNNPGSNGPFQVQFSARFQF